jgi:hypothetical protein
LENVETLKIKKKKKEQALENVINHNYSTSDLLKKYKK